MNIWAYLSLATGCLIILVIFIDVLADVWYRYETDEMIRQHKQNKILNRIRKEGKEHGKI